MSTVTESYDRAKEVKQFEDSKIGVKGLVDSGITSIPQFFVHPPETLSEISPSKTVAKPDPHIIPIIDLSGADSMELRPKMVEKIARASREVGFFQIINHGISLDVMERLIGAIRGFHEQPTEVKAKFYSREHDRGALFFSNVDIYHSQAASWRDTLVLTLSPNTPELDEFPEICGKEALEWNNHMKQLGELLMGLLSEGLGMGMGRMKEIMGEGRKMIGNYYPYCPQPDLTVGIQCHTDPGALAVLLQTHHGGLQCRYGGNWVDVTPVPGALVVNIGDLLQIMSNDEYVSVDHRALANSSREAIRVSAVVLFGMDDLDRLVGPFPELVSLEKPARFRQFTFADYLNRFYSKVLDEKTLVNYYRL